MYELTEYAKTLLEKVPKEIPVTVRFKNLESNLRVLPPAQYERFYHEGSALIQKKGSSSPAPKAETKTDKK